MEIYKNSRFAYYVLAKGLIVISTVVLLTEAHCCHPHKMPNQLYMFTLTSRKEKYLKYLYTYYKQPKASFRACPNIVKSMVVKERTQNQRRFRNVA